MDLGQAISRALVSLQTVHGAKEVASWFDGRGGKEVALSTVSRWISRPDRFPATFLPVLVQAYPPLGRHLMRHLPIWLGIPDRVVTSLPPEQAEQVQREFERLVVEEVGPGRWVSR